MARIRSDKPESYQSETLAEISLAAERTFRGMATRADDRGRLPDKPAQINGELWSMRSEREPHTTADLEAELQEMVKADLICRYIGCDGKRYIHPVTWDAHQKIDRPSKSRLPRCPHHQPGDGPDSCGLHEGPCPSREPSMHTRESSMLGQTVQTGIRGDGERPDRGELTADMATSVHPDDGQSSDQQERSSSRVSREPSMQDLGSRTVDRGPRNIKDPSADVDNQSSGRNARATEDPVIQRIQQAIYSVTSRAIDALWAEWIRDRIAKLAKDDGLGPAYFDEVIHNEPDPFGRFIEHEPPPPWCGECNPYRRLEDPETGDDAGPCPGCHPSQRKETAA